MKPRYRSKAWLCLLLVGGFLVLLVLAAERQFSDIKAVENAIDRDWEISFEQTALPFNRPARLPSFLDSGAKAWFDWQFANTYGYSRPQPVKTRNRAIVYHERFRSLFRGPIEVIDIGYPEGFRGDELGAALARFPKLRRFCVMETDDPGPSEAEWTLLCRGLRALPQLEDIELGGAWLTDAAIAPLAGHPNLRDVTIQVGRLGPECTKTFATLPRLSRLLIGEQRYEGDTWLSPEEEKAMRAALPGVTVEVFLE